MACGRAADAIRRQLRNSGKADGVELATSELPELGGLPEPVWALIADLLDDLSEGRGAAIAPDDMLVGTEAVAEVLGVSRQWATTLIDRGDLPAIRMGSKRRVLLGDLMRFRREDARRRRQAVTDWSFLVEDPAEPATDLDDNQSIRQRGQRRRAAG